MKRVPPTAFSFVIRPAEQGAEVARALGARVAALVTQGIGRSERALPTPTPAWSVEVEDSGGARAAWERLQDTLGPAAIVVQSEGEPNFPRFPTGRVTVRCDAGFSDEALQLLERRHGLKLVRRAAFTDCEAHMAPTGPVYMPDLLAELAGDTSVDTAWLDADSVFRRG